MVRQAQLSVLGGWQEMDWEAELCQCPALSGHCDLLTRGHWGDLQGYLYVSPSRCQGPGGRGELLRFLLPPSGKTIH